jgi:hypothetical protein
MIEFEERIPKREILKIYKIDRMTFDDWVRERGLPVIEVTSHSKYVRKSDLIEWEESLIKNRN